MLVLSRKTEGVVVCDLGSGREMLVKVIEVRNGTVRLGFEAPRDVGINRREVHEAKLTGLPTKLLTPAGG